MTQRSWVAAVCLPLALSSAAAVRAQDAESEPPKIVGIDAVQEDGGTKIRIETTADSISYISYSRDPKTFVVDLYGFAVDDIPSRLEVGSPEVVGVTLEGGADAGNFLVAKFLVERTAPGSTRIDIEGRTLVIRARLGANADVDGPGRQVRQQAVPVARTSSAQARPASWVEDVLVGPVAGGLGVTIFGDGQLSYESFALDNPPRLVIDLHGVDSRVAMRTIPVRHAAVDRIRVAQFKTAPDRVARVVFDLGEPMEYKVVAAGNELRVRFGAEAVAQLNADVEPSAVVSVVPFIGEAAQGAPPSTPTRTPGITSDSFSPTIPAPSTPTPTAGVASDNYAPTIYGTVNEEEGTLISFDLKDADIKDVLRYFSEISGLNIIVDPGVNAKVTVRLIDVPWNKALDIVLKAHGYGKSLDGNVLRIAAVSKLTTEEADVAALRLAQEEAKPLVTITRAISYAEATQIATIIQKTALSAKGSIIIDQRSNTLVITEVDIPAYHKRIIDLIKTLDTPTPQVEIEARIIETSKSFSRSWGLQWGFNQTFDQSTGSTTDFTFPNSGFVSGDLVKGTSGFTSALPSGGWAVNVPSSGANAGIGFHLANITDQFQLDVVLSALEDEGKGRVLSAPKITTQSNVAASIQSGSSIPVQTIANNTITVQYIAANLNLSVTPQVTADQTIILKVTVNQSSPDFGTKVGTAQLPPITTRQANTTLMVPDGGTAVIGGVFQLTEGEAQNRLPGVHRIPVLGWLFKNHSETRVNNELLIFITPKIKSII